MTVPIEAQEIYVKNLEVLFDGAVKAEPWQINQEVIDCADAMFEEITVCNLRIANFLGTLTTIAGLLTGGGMLPKVAQLILDHENKTLYDYIKDYGWKKIRLTFYEATKLGNYKDYLEFLEFCRNMYDIWIRESKKNRRYRLCINNARANWRTRVELALLDI